jgi:hypothetical protein
MFYVFSIFQVTFFCSKFITKMNVVKKSGKNKSGKENPENKSGKVNPEK